MHTNLIFGGSLLALFFTLHAFAHARLLGADMHELERLHREGLLPAESTPDQDFRIVSSLLAAIGPAVHVREETWVRLYYLWIRSAGVIASFSRWLADPITLEMRRLAAHESAQYRLACVRLAALRPL